FAFSLWYFFPVKAWVQRSIFVFIIFSPLNLYLANTVASDTIFGALTLLWLAELFHILFRPRLHHLAFEAILLFFCFTLRNTTYYYPLVAALAIILSKQVIWKKILGITFPFLFLVPYILFTENAAYKLTGTRTFSLLTGWQLANNALYFYNKVQVDSSD